MTTSTEMKAEATKEFKKAGGQRITYSERTVNGMHILCEAFKASGNVKPGAHRHTFRINGKAASVKQVDAI